MVSSLFLRQQFDYEPAGGQTVYRLETPDLQGGRLFFWRGALCFAGDRWTYKLNATREWDVFCQYAHFASSANGKYWAVRDENGQPFLVEFGP